MHNPSGRAFGHQWLCSYSSRVKAYKNFLASVPRITMQCEAAKKGTWDNTAMKLTLKVAAAATASSDTATHLLGIASQADTARAALATPLARTTTRRPRRLRAPPSQPAWLSPTAAVMVSGAGTPAARPVGRQALPAAACIRSRSQRASVLPRRHAQRIRFASWRAARRARSAALYAARATESAGQMAPAAASSAIRVHSARTTSARRPRSSSPPCRAPPPPSSVAAP